MRCPFGKYAGTGSKQCTVCPAGTLGDCGGLGCDSPNCAGKCPVGFYCKEGENKTQCTNKDKSTDAADTYLDTEGGTSQASCKSCNNFCANITCQDCTHTGECQIFNDHCLVDGNCYKNYATDPTSSCRICNRDGTDIGLLRKYKCALSMSLFEM